MATRVPQLRCRGCWATTTLLPDAILPLVHYSLDTIGAAIEAYCAPGPRSAEGEAPGTSYRSVALDLTGNAVPAGLTLTGYLGGIEAPPIGPSHIYRWVARFSDGAEQWWREISAEAQGQIDHALSTPAAPELIEAKGRTPEKRRQLSDAWALLWVLRFLLSLLGRPTKTWPYALLASGRRPRLLDHTGWFAVGPRAPP